MDHGRKVYRWRVAGRCADFTKIYTGIPQNSYKWEGREGMKLGGGAGNLG